MDNEPKMLEEGRCVCTKEYTITNQSESLGKKGDTATIKVGREFKYATYDTGDVCVYEVFFAMIIDEDVFQEHFERLEG